MPVEKTKGRDEEFAVPPVAVSPITGITGAVNWGGLNKFSIGSRYVIADSEADELVNWLPQQSCFQQVPGPGATIGTLPGGTAIWQYTEILNGSVFIYTLSNNGTLYQMSTGGAFTTVGTGFATGTNQVDLANWQGTNILITDVVQQKIFNWNGTTLATVFSTQPENFVAVYSGRLWMSNGITITWTNSGTFNSLAGDSGSFAITDGKCGNPILGMVDFGGSLYVGGSNWIKTINNLADTGSPAVLTFQQPTLQSQVGWINKQSIVLLGTNMFFANLNGFWMISGAVPVKISQPLDGFFQNIDGTNSTFTGAYGMIYNKQCLFWTVRWNGDTNYTVFGYTSDQLWFRVTPATGSGAGIAKFITGIVSSAITNNQPKVYACDGTNIFDLFGSPAATVSSTFNTKVWDFYSKLTADLLTNFAVQLIVTAATTITVSEIGSLGGVQGPATPSGPASISYNPSLGDWTNVFGQTVRWQNNTPTVGSWTGVGTQIYALSQFVVPFQDRSFGVNITVSGVQTVLQAFVISYRKMMLAKG